MVAEVTSRRAKRRRHLAELLLYTVMVPALTILTSPLGVHLDYCTSQTGLGDDNRVRLPAPPRECVLLWLLDWVRVAQRLSSRFKSKLASRKKTRRC